MGNSARERSTLRIGSIPSESVSCRVNAMLELVRFFVERILHENTIEGRKKVQEEMGDVLFQVDPDGNPVYSNEDRKRIIKGVESRLCIFGVCKKRLDTGQVRKKRVSEIKRKKLPKPDGWTPDFMKSLTGPLDS